jgi:two-component system LytT family response regulator
VRIRALIVDDEPLARERIRALLRKERDIELLGECGDGARAIAAIEKHRPDLVFLDEQMPEADGFEVVKAVGADNMPTVIFVTAFDKYALRAFDVHALDYLLKPFDRERFAQALDRARAQIRRQRAGDIHRRLFALLGEVRPQPRRNGWWCAKRDGSSSYVARRSTGLKPRATTCGWTSANMYT